jgi:hypothetical protein
VRNVILVCEKQLERVISRLALPWPSVWLAPKCK